PYLALDVRVDDALPGVNPLVLCLLELVAGARAQHRQEALEGLARLKADVAQRERMLRPRAVLDDRSVHGAPHALDQRRRILDADPLAAHLRVEPLAPVLVASGVRRVEALDI